MPAVPDEVDAPRTWVERRCLAGLAEAAAALAGDDPAPVCGRFAAWKRGEGRGAWPWLPGLAWDALQPLGVAFPADDGVAVTLGRFLVGVETNPQRVRDALAAVAAGQASAAPQRSRPAGEPAGAREQLADALDGVWHAFARTAAAVRVPGRDGDRARADRLVLASRRQLEEHAHTLGTHARRIAATVPAPQPPVPAPEPESPIRALPAARPEAAAGAVETADLLDPAPNGAGSSFDRRWPAADVEYSSGRERRLAPVLFLAGATLVALIWLLVIVGGNG